MNDQTEDQAEKGKGRDATAVISSVQEDIVRLRLTDPENQTGSL